MAVPIFLLSKYCCCLVQKPSEKVVLFFCIINPWQSLPHHHEFLQLLVSMASHGRSHTAQWAPSQCHSSTNSALFLQKDLRVFNASQESGHAWRWRTFSIVLFYIATVNFHSKSNICSTVLKGTGTLLLQQGVLQKPSRHKFPWVSFLIF